MILILCYYLVSTFLWNDNFGKNQTPMLSYGMTTISKIWCAALTRKHVLSIFCCF